MFSLRILAIFALVAFVSAFVVPQNQRIQTSLFANCVDTLATLQGPGVCWGSEGVALGHEENDLKGYDNFGTFVNHLKSTGVANELAGSGPFTVFAPTDTAFEKTTKPITAEVIKMHIVPGRFTKDDIKQDLPTLAGKALKYERKFRMTFVEDAVVGHEDNFGGGSKFPVDVAADNGVLHAIDCVLGV
mmetsp:Transcript_42841/g.69940  ORF Transcript_42841/g.69940 Transcript_42841/m.69940 type:complete len:188 (-) Transcript_42841:338-901(-)